MEISSKQQFLLFLFVSNNNLHVKIIDDLKDVSIKASRIFLLSEYLFGKSLFSGCK